MPRRSPRALLVAVTLLIFPLLAIPAYLVGVDVGGAVDKDRTNGVFPLEFILGVGLPGVLATLVASMWGKLKVFPALALGIGSSVISLVVIFVALVIWCSAVDCIV